jgi:hypothetical protein
MIAKVRETLSESQVQNALHDGLYVPTTR